MRFSVLLSLKIRQTDRSFQVDKKNMIFNCLILIKLLLLQQSCGWQSVALPIGDIL